MQNLRSIEIETADEPDAAIIWLHGLGADGNDFVPIVPELGLPSELAIRFVFPHAPVRPVTINQGYMMPAWYDIIGADVVSKEDEDGIRAASKAIAALCDEQENRGIASNRIILAGFSQGGAVALHCGLRYPKPLAGIMALSTYLPLRSNLEAEASAANRNTDIFIAHGLHDEVVASQFGKQSYWLLRDADYPIHFHGYDMAHEVCTEELSEIGEWVTEVLREQSLH